MKKHDRTPPMKGYLKPAEVANMANFLISENTKSISVKYLGLWNSYFKI
jgi:hypothetical protein